MKKITNYAIVGYPNILIHKLDGGELFLGHIDDVSNKLAKQVLIKGQVFSTNSSSVYWDVIENMWKIMFSSVLTLVVFGDTKYHILGKTKYDPQNHIILYNQEDQNTYITNKKSTNYTKYKFIPHSEAFKWFPSCLEYNLSTDHWEVILEVKNLKFQPVLYPFGAEIHRGMENDGKIFLDKITVECIELEDIFRAAPQYLDSRTKFIYTYSNKENKRLAIALYFILLMIEEEYNNIFPPMYKIMPEYKQLPLPNLKLHKVDLDTAYARILNYTKSRRSSVIYHHFYIHENKIIFRSIPNKILNFNSFTLFYNLHKAIIDFATQNVELILKGNIYNLMFIVENSSIQERIKDAFYELSKNREDEINKYKAQYMQRGSCDNPTDLLELLTYEFTEEGPGPISEPVGVQHSTDSESRVPVRLYYEAAPVVRNDDDEYSSSSTDYYSIQAHFYDEDDGYWNDEEE